jgi:hypothetical protein
MSIGRLSQEKLAEAKAQGLYNKLGFEINKVQPISNTQHKLLYRKRPL